MNHSGRITFRLVLTMFLAVLTAPAYGQQKLDLSELNPILKTNGLTTKQPRSSHQEVSAIEEADAKLYGPTAGETVYLEAAKPTADSGDIRPRYWLRVEDYATEDEAAKRASEYVSADTYNRLERAYGSSSFAISKESVRMWAIARGKRVYALTTNVNLLTYIELQKKLRSAINSLPRK